MIKFSPTGSRIYSTFLAGEGDDAGGGIAVDATGNAYVVGSTASRYFPIRAAFQPRPGGITDAFVTQLNREGTRILFSSYLGGGRPTNSLSLTEGDERGTGLALGPDGSVHLTGLTLSANFPATCSACSRARSRQEPGTWKPPELCPLPTGADWEASRSKPVNRSSSPSPLVSTAHIVFIASPGETRLAAADQLIVLPPDDHRAFGG